MVLLQSDPKALRPGDAAPRFDLRNVDEQMISIDRFEGKSLVVAFICNHCPYVRAKIEELSQITKDYAPRDVAVVFINPNDADTFLEDDFEHMQRFAEDHQLEFYLVDGSGDVARAYGAVCTPDLFVFDKQHRLVYHGRVDDAMGPEQTPQEHTLRNVLSAMTDGKPIKDWFVPSRGCSIKWR